MKKALLDTNILSYFLRGETQVVKKFREYQQFHSYLTFSVLTYYEIKSGLLYKDAKNLLQQFEIRFFGYFYGKPGSKSLKVLLCRHFIENMEIIVYNPCPVRVLLSSILNYHKRDARA